MSDHRGDLAPGSALGWEYALARTTRALTVAALVVLSLAVTWTILVPAPAVQASPRFRPLGASARPLRLVIPSLKISAPIVPIAVSAAGVLTPPSDYREVGWWDRSARPGSTGGQTVITGHTVHTGGGEFDHLGDLRPGSSVRITTKRGTLWYRTTKVVVYSRATLAKKATALFSQQRTANRLVLITCTGWTGHDYTSNVVVLATPLGVPAGAAS